MNGNSPIKAARAERNMTQKELAEAVGISRQTMNAIEQGEHNPTIRLCRAICRVLGKSLDELFGEAGACCEPARQVEPMFLAECDALESTLLAEMLKEARIPFLQKGVLGAGFLMRAAPQLERYAFYVPQDKQHQAWRCLDDLRAPADQPGEKASDMPG